MLCRFCKQWNPDGAKRCCFCQNDLEATEDATAAHPRGAPRPSASFSSVSTSKSSLESVPLWQIGAGMATAIALVVLLKTCL
jgi:hypothetical protein